MSKRWIYKDIPSKEEILLLCSRLNISKPVATILLQRNIKEYESAKKFFRPSLNDIYDPFLLKNMEKAVERIKKAIKLQENILIYGDYDVDGSTGTVLLYQFIKPLNPNIYYYIPDRYIEGYGISESGIEWAKKNNISLLISVDCGIRACDTVSLANKFNIQTIVTDHHEQGNELPPAFAIINPKQKGCTYPFKGLSGCGVAFKVIHAITKCLNLNEENIYDYLDLVAVSIAADIVPIIDENRILSYYGMKNLVSKPRPAFQFLNNTLEKKTKISVSSIVFGIAPIINAAGRIKHASLAVEFLLSKNAEEAQTRGKYLKEINSTRRAIDEEITAEALGIIERDESTKYTTVLFKEDWHLGVIGIVASRCIERYHRPTVILTHPSKVTYGPNKTSFLVKNYKRATGSVRSVPGFNVYNAIEACKEYLHKYGGHAFAAGLTLNVENIDKFKAKFEQVVSKTINPDMLVPAQKIDLSVSFKELSLKMYSIISQMAPFGPGNMSPVFTTSNVIIRNYKILKEKHLKLYVTENSFNEQLEAIGFFMPHLFDLVNTDSPIELAYKVDLNEYNNQKKLILKICDIKLVREKVFLVE